ncbi:MAG: hypothetical protein JWP69_995 [Flaviaesturariibacter sp.]|nr:hypothetical protein [Flaviaesturariibacter sp.]
MKFFTTFLLTTLTLTVFAQQADTIGIASNSFENSYRKLNPTLKYSYDNTSQTHNYSNNWDFDKDGINDEVYFIGTGGAHLYYFLKVVLSTDHKPREFDFIQSDLPSLTATDTLNFDKTSLGFVVTDFGKNLTPTIIVRLDEQTFYDNKELKKRKIKTKNVLVSFENGKPKYGCL